MFPLVIQFLLRVEKKELKIHSKVTAKSQLLVSLKVGCPILIADK